jgi:hypothetical protein
VALLVVWMIAVCTIFYCLGAFHMAYMHVGPGEDTVFMGLKIDNWGKWSALASFSFLNTCINEFISNALGPWFVKSLQASPGLGRPSAWFQRPNNHVHDVVDTRHIMNTVIINSPKSHPPIPSLLHCLVFLQDHKTRSTEYSHATCLWIVQIHCMYVHVMGVFSLFLYFSRQVDFAMIRLLADWIITGYSTVWFIQVRRVPRIKKKFEVSYGWHACTNPL